MQARSSVRQQTCGALARVLAPVDAIASPTCVHWRSWRRCKARSSSRPSICKRQHDLRKRSGCQGSSGRFTRHEARPIVRRATRSRLTVLSPRLPASCGNSLTLLALKSRGHTFLRHRKSGRCWKHERQMMREDQATGKLLCSHQETYRKPSAKALCWLLRSSVLKQTDFYLLCWLLEVSVVL